MASLHLRVLLWLGILCLVSCVGIKRRLAEDADELAAEGVAKSSSPDPRPRGGVRQRASTRAHPAHPHADRQGPLNQYLKEQWAAGHLNTKQVQEVALRATQQGAIGVERLGSMGSDGRYANNLFRAVKSILGMPKGAPDFFWAEIPTRSGLKTPHPFLLPHQFFASFYKECRPHWSQTVCGPSGAAAEFWQAISGLDFVKKHPALPLHERHRTIPLGFHGDGGAFSKQDNLYVLSWNSLLGTGSTIQKRFVCTVVRKYDMTTATLEAILEILSWSFNVLLSGRRPTLDYLGRPTGDADELLADGYRHEGGLHSRLVSYTPRLRFANRGHVAFGVGRACKLSSSKGCIMSDSGRLGFLHRDFQVSPVERCPIYVLDVPGFVNAAAFDVF